MPVEQRSTGNRKRKVIFILLLLSIFTLYLTAGNYFSYNDDDYISQFLLPSEKQQIAAGQVAKATNMFYDGGNKHVNIDKPESTTNIIEPNISITVLRTEDAKTTFNVVYPEVPKIGISRNVFVEMKDINKSTQNIFFIETRCATEKTAVHFKGNKGLVLNARQCCSIESTAQMNLDHTVYLFHSCFLHHDFFEYSPKYVAKLFKYPNVYVVRLNTSEVFINSPIEELHQRKVLETSAYPIEHTSDLIRLVLLWKFGGTYSDLDVVTIRSLNKLETNWAGMQDAETIANGVINFEPEGVGHHILQRALEFVNVNYDPNNWSTNGPLLITRFILQECGVQKVVEAQKHCHGNFTVFNSTVLYPVYYTLAANFFNNNLGKKLIPHIKNTSYSVHIWNKMSHDMVVTVGSDQAYALLADEYCPQVYRNCGPSF